MPSTALYIILLAAGASFVQRTVGFGFDITSRTCYRSSQLLAGDDKNGTDALSSLTDHTMQNGLQASWSILRCVVC